MTGYGDLRQHFIVAFQLAFDHRQIPKNTLWYA